VVEYVVVELELCHRGYHMVACLASDRSYAWCYGREKSDGYRVSQASYTTPCCVLVVPEYIKSIILSKSRAKKKLQQKNQCSTCTNKGTVQWGSCPMKDSHSRGGETPYYKPLEVVGIVFVVFTSKDEHRAIPNFCVCTVPHPRRFHGLRPEGLDGQSLSRGWVPVLP
jgi:hypothetical protein